LKTKVEIVANNPPVDLYYPVSGFEFEFRSEGIWRHIGNLDASAANVCYCWSYCEFVHNGNR
jgi:hypothetical protein